jgi:N-acetylneuraminate synthase
MFEHLKTKPYLIAEIGINHNGSIKNAKKLIDLAKKYNFDAVKFQKRNPEISTPDYQKNLMRETPWGHLTYLEYKKKIEFSESDYLKINNYCKEKKIDWFASAWDVESQIFLKQFNCKYNKVASAMLTNIELLKVIAEEKKHTFISTGMNSINDITKCVNIFKKKKCKYTLLHCVSIYPAPEESLNLLTINFLKKKFRCAVGYSGHESAVSPSILAYILGATVIERHITLDRSMWGTDQAASLAEDGIKNLTSIILKIPKILGKETIKKSKDEINLLKKFKYW